MSVQYVHFGDDLQAALDNAQPGDTLHLEAGEYRQKVVIRTPGITLVGEGADRTIIVWDDYANKIHADGKEYNTFRTWTVAVCADGVQMSDLSIVNDSLRPEEKGQEVALTVYGDRFAMLRCRLTSTQDTLFLGPLPRDLIQRYDGFLPDELRADRLLTQVFLNCLIEGTVDFIFGCGNAVFDNCTFRSLVDARNVGYVAAPAHSLEDAPDLPNDSEPLADRDEPQGICIDDTPVHRDGFTFRYCRFTSEEGVAPGSVYLARPWRDYGLCRFTHCTYGPHIAPEGFDKWNDTDRDKTARFYEEPPVPGRVPWANRR